MISKSFDDRNVSKVTISELLKHTLSQSVSEMYRGTEIRIVVEKDEWYSWKQELINAASNNRDIFTLSMTTQQPLGQNTFYRTNVTIWLYKECCGFSFSIIELNNSSNYTYLEREEGL